MIRERMLAGFRIITALLLTLSLAGCGGFFPSKNTITSLSISPNGAFIVPEGTEQYSATATFGDNSTGDVTSSVTWASSQTSVATINASGLATGVALGTTSITAKSSNNVTASATLTVSAKTVTALTVSPTNASISLSSDQMQQFTAIATFSDGTFSNVTSLVDWVSSAPGVAVIISTGLASPVALGTTTIEASYGGQIATTSLAVIQ